MWYVHAFLHALRVVARSHCFSSVCTAMWQGVFLVMHLQHVTTNAVARAKGHWQRGGYAISVGAHISPLWPVLCYVSVRASFGFLSTPCCTLRQVLLNHRQKSTTSRCALVIFACGFASSQTVLHRCLTG